VIGAALDFFAAGPARIKWLLIGAGVLAVAVLALIAFGLYWRGEAYQARGERDLALAQISVLSVAVETCSSSVDHAKRAADAAVQGTAALLAEARRLKAPTRHTVERIEKIIREPAPPGAGCDEAWSVIEQSARGTP